MLNLLQKFLEMVFGSWLKNKFPQYAGIIDNLSVVASLALEVVHAAEASGADGATKKKQAAINLLKALQEKKIDIPGDQDQAVCEVVVEAMVQVLKRRGF